MGAVLYIVGLLFLAVSLLGFMAFVNRFDLMDAAYVPAFVISSITLIALLAGMAGVLMPICLVLHALGVVAFVVTLVMDRGVFGLVSFVKVPAVVFFLALCAFGVALLSNVALNHYDDFSFWGAVVRDLHDANALPGDGSRIDYGGLFMNYMPTSACFIYYADLVTGYSEGHALVAQFIMLSSAAAVFLSPLGREGTSRLMGVPLALAALLAFVFVQGQAFFYSLLTDTLLALFGAAAAVVLVRGSADMPKMLRTAIPLLLVTLCIKDAGKVFFVALVVCACIQVVMLRVRGMLDKGATRKSAGVLAVIVLVGVAIQLAWRMHVNASYTLGYSASKFSIGLSMFSEVQVPPGEVAGLIFKYGFLPPSVYALPFWALVVGSVAVVVAKKQPTDTRWRVFTGLGYALVVVLATCVELLLLYSFIMPAAETSGWEGTLPGFSRYFGCSVLFAFCVTAVTLVEYLFTAGTVSAVEPEEGRPASRNASVVKAAMLSAALLLVTLPLTLGFNSFIAQRVDSLPGFLRGQRSYEREVVAQTVSPDCSPVTSNSTLVVAFGDDARNTFEWFLAIYESGARVYELDGWYAEHPDVLVERVENADMFVIVGDGDAEAAERLEPFGIEIAPHDENQDYFKAQRDGSTLTLQPLDL